jgi:hypothetical protein
MKNSTIQNPLEIESYGAVPLGMTAPFPYFGALLYMRINSKVRNYEQYHHRRSLLGEGSQNG